MSAPEGLEEKPARRKVARGSKREGVLRVLLDRGARGLTRFQAEKLCSDHVLPSTVSELCKDFALLIPRELVTVPGHCGKPTECALYRLSAEDVVKVRALLGEQEATA